MIRARVFDIADAYQRAFQQAYDCCQNFFARHAAQFQVSRHAAVQTWKSFAECHHPLEFMSVTHEAPLFVIAILLASPRIESCRLQVALRIDTNPHVFVCRWYCKLANAVACGGVAYALSTGHQIIKPGSCAT